jgi:hypothetical protein
VQSYREGIVRFCPIAMLFKKEIKEIKGDIGVRGVRGVKADSFDY